MAEEKKAEEGKPEEEAEIETVATEGAEPTEEEQDEIKAAMEEHEEWIMQRIKEVLAEGTPSSSPEVLEELKNLRAELTETRESLKAILQQSRPQAPLQESLADAQERKKAAEEGAKPKQRPMPDWI